MPGSSQLSAAFYWLSTISISSSLSCSIQFGVVEQKAAALVVLCLVPSQCFFYTSTPIKSCCIQNNRQFIDGMKERNIGRNHGVAIMFMCIMCRWWFEIFILLLLAQTTFAPVSLEFRWCWIWSCHLVGWYVYQWSRSRDYPFTTLITVWWCTFRYGIQLGSDIENIWPTPSPIVHPVSFKSRAICTPSR